MSDPRKAETLGEACANNDGTYSGTKLLSWLSDVLNPGRGLSEGEVAELWRQARAKKESK